jgi:hypothetical protein
VAAEHVLILTQKGSFSVLGDQLSRLLSRKSVSVRTIDWQKTGIESADIVIVLWWHCITRGALKSIRSKRGVIGAVFDTISWSTPHTKALLGQAIRSMDVLVVGNEWILSGLRAAFGSLPPAVICETGADLKHFKPSAFPSRFEAGWAGNSLASDQRPGPKGVRHRHRGGEHGRSGAERGRPI